MDYIRSVRSGDEGCIFCTLPTRDDDDAKILARTGSAFVAMNAFPYNPGHVMAAPLRHVGALEDLDDTEMQDVGRSLQRAVRAIQEEMKPDGFNLGMNLGRVAGAGYPGHVHWHVVPRWSGDVNFMPVTGQTRVLPELIDETYAKLKPRFERTS